MYSLPNIITLARIAMLPIIIGLLFIPESWAAWAALYLYAGAAMTDFVDGYLARSMNLESAFGQFLDPIADKIFVGALLIVLVGFDRLPGILMIPAVIILIREFMVAGMREFLSPHNVQFPVTKLAKWKTTIQMFAMGFLIVGDYGNTVLPYNIIYGQVMITVAAILTAVTGWSYLSVGLGYIKQLDNGGIKK
jgi:cardiolipin synthase